MGDDAEIVKEFLIESYENLDRLDHDLIALEKDPASRDTLASVFRTIHTIKGTCGFLAFHRLEALTHVGENLLARLRDGLLTLNPGITTGLLQMVDVVRQMLKSIEETGGEGDRQDQELVATLTRMLEPAPKSISPPEATVSVEEHQSPIEPARNQEVSRVPVDSPDPFSAGPVRAGDGLPEESGKARASAESQEAQPQAKGQSAGDSTIRIDVGQLDRLMNRVGELVLLRNQIVQYANSVEDSELLGASRRLDLLTTELQESVMKTRMQPIGNIWSKFPRTVRDVALGCGKQVRIEMEGKETELDRTVLEAIKDPLTHLVRNAVDHGIENPEQRLVAGKEKEGCLLLRAFHEGGQVRIEVTDDGAGLDRDKLRKKAIQKGLITPEHAARMSEREVANLIFVPGFSTAEKVTNVSGRGVGLDVVKTNIEKIGGTVEVQSFRGHGSTVRMKIPLTLAIIPALIVTSAGDRYAIPQASLIELVRLESDEANKSLELVNGAPVYRLRGRLLPLVYLNRELKVDLSGQSQGSQIGRAIAESVNIVILRADHRQFALAVDEINDTEEIVVKPLHKRLKNINAYAGATIMGDGKVALILDVVGLAQRAHIVSEVCVRAVTDQGEKQCIDTSDASQRQAVLLLQHGDGRRIATDLQVVARLEEFPSNAIEMAAHHEVVQYRGQIMPLVRISQVLDNERQGPANRNQESLHVVVYAQNGGWVGLVVDRVLDIVEEPFVLQPHTGRKGVLGTAVIQKRVTEVVDVPGLIAVAGETALAASDA